MTGAISAERDQALRDAAARRIADGRHRQMVEAAPNAMVLINAGGTIEMVNAQAERVFGYRRAEMLGRPVELLVPERYRGKHPNLRDAFFQEPQSRPMGAGRELYGLRKDGSEFPVEIGLNPIETEDGVMVLSAIVDITERKRADAALRESEERFRFMVEGVKDYGIFMLDPQGCVASWNAGAEQMKQYRAEEIVGRHFSCFYLEEDAVAGRPDRELRVAAESGRFEDEGWRLRKDGTRFWASVVISANRDETGRLVGFAKIVRDITERRRLEERFRHVVEAAPNAMVMVNAAGLVEMVNTQTERVFGYSRSELLGKHVEVLVPQRLRRQHPDLREAFFQDPRSRPMGAGRDLYGLRKDGSEFPVEIGLNPIETQDGTMVLSAIVDISDRKQKEHRIEAALKEKDVLLGEIHHRVKNNLQIVDSLLDLQSARITDPVARDLLHDSRNRIRSMAQIHQTLYQSKDFAAVEFGYFLDALVPTLVAAYGVSSSEVTLTVDAEQVRLPLEAAVPCGLAVNELITNALKHAFPNGRSGEIAVRLEHVAAGELELSVTDDGIGIPDHVQPDAAPTLGLQLVMLLADQLGGGFSVRRAGPTRCALRFPDPGTRGAPS